MLAGWAGAGSAAAIGAAAMATAAAPAAIIGVMVFNPIRMVKRPFDSCLPCSSRLALARIDYVAADTQWFFRITGMQSVKQTDGRWADRRDEVRGEVLGTRKPKPYVGFGIDSVDQRHRHNP
jgi:hypothetical protein